MSNQFYQPGAWKSKRKEVLSAKPLSEKPKLIPGYCIMPLETVLGVTNNIQTAVKAHLDGNVSEKYGDPLQFILRITEELRNLAIKSTAPPT